jgi:hypothetical protein
LPRYTAPHCTHSHHTMHQRMYLTLSPPAVKTQCLSQCQAFQCLVRSSHTLVNWILNNFWSTESIDFHSVECVFENIECPLHLFAIQYKHSRSIKKESLG